MTHEPLLGLPDRFILRRVPGWLLGRVLPLLLAAPFVAPTLVPTLAPTLVLLMTVGFTAPSLAQEPVFSNDGMLWEGEAVTEAQEAAQGATKEAANELDQDRAVLALDAALNLDEHSQLILAEPDADEVARRMAPGNSPAKDAVRQPQQTGFTRELQGFAQLASSPAGTRRSSNGRDYVVSQRLVGSAGAVSIRLHFSDVHLPAGARLYVYGQADDGGQHSTQHDTQQRGYDSAWLGDRTSFWSHTVAGDSAVVEYHALLDNGTTDRAASYTVDQVVHNVDIFSDEGATSADASICNLNMCDNPAWRTVGNGVVRLRYIKNGRSGFCSGALLNNHSRTGTPYIYTANHCISTQSVASTVEIEYFYQRNQCSDNPTDNAVRRLGSMLLVTAGGNNDHTLLQANTPPPSGAALLGWNAGSINLGTAVTGIHHPRTDFKRISFGNKTANHANAHIVTLSGGILESGSSGSPLIINGPDRNSVHVIGTASSVHRQHSCSNPQLPVYYGKFSRAYPAFSRYLANSSQPDLIVDNVNVSNTTPEVGTAFTINATVRNPGAEATAATTLRYYRSADRTITTNDTELGTDAVGGLATGAFSTQSTTVSIADAGTWWIGACADRVTAETATNNNCSTGVRVTITAPDLVVDNFSVSASPREAGAAFTMRDTVRNQGNGAAAATTLRYFSSNDAVITTTDTELATAPVGRLAANRSSHQSASVSIANAGTWWVGTCVDAVNGELARTNNCSGAGHAVQVIITAPPITTPTRPDLAVDSVRVSQSSVEAGASFTIDATVRNSGDGAAAGSTLRYYRSATSTIATTDTLLATDSVSALVAGATSSENAAVSIANTGNYWVGACVSTVGGETEADNNCSSGVAVSITAPPVTAPTRPDLAVDSVRVSQSSVETGASFTINATVRNSGDGAAAGSTLRYYRSATSTIATTDTLLATDPVSALVAGATSSENAAVSIANTGNYWVGACVSTVSGETEADNNCSSGVAVSVTAPPVTAPTRPDLAVDSVRISQSSVEAGASFTINATVRNSGDRAAPGSTLRYYRSANNTITTTDTILATDPVSALAPGATSAEDAAASIADAGEYWVGACVSTVGGETEADNNCSTGVAVTITTPTLPDLTVDNVSVAESSVEVGTAFTINATARNSGNRAAAATTLNYFRSDDATITTADTEVATDPVGPLAPGGTSQQNAVVAITETGTWWVGACVSTVSDETETGNNCSDGVQVTVTAPDLIVDSISVAEPSVEADAVFTINATVRNQGTAASVATTLHYYGSDDSTITASDTQLATKSVETLAAGASSPQNAEVVIADAGAYWVGACVAKVNNESATDNNCSAGVQVTVTARPDNNNGILPAIIQLLLLP